MNQTPQSPFFQKWACWNSFFARSACPWSSLVMYLRNTFDCTKTVSINHLPPRAGRLRPWQTFSPDPQVRPCQKPPSNSKMFLALWNRNGPCAGERQEEDSYRVQASPRLNNKSRPVKERVQGGFLIQHPNVSLDGLFKSSTEAPTV